jgi:membrane protein implicated in regulation of membrane protease activity
MMAMDGNNGTRLAGSGGRRGSWPVYALLVVGGWLVVSPLVLSTARATAGVVSAVTGGLALAVLAGWAMVARAEWNSILAGLLILLLVGSALLADRRRQGRSVPTAGGEQRRHVEAGGERR